MRKTGVAAATLAATALLAGCGGGPAPAGAGSPSPSATSAAPAGDETRGPGQGRRAGEQRQTIVVTRVVDGDTFEARGVGAGPVPRRVVDVRMLEIDTVERGECGYQAATDKLAGLLGDRVTVERDRDLKDRYGRWLLYVWNAGGTFVNLELVEEGWAAAVLYQPNDKYWDRISAADTSDTYTPWPPCHTPQPDPPDPPDPPPEAPDDEGEQESSYLFPPPPPDKDCGDVSASGFRVRPGDPHRFDADGDGVGCES